MNLSTVIWAQWDNTQSGELLVCSYVCALHCAQLLHTILHRTDLIIFPLTLQTITIAAMMSIWGKGGVDFSQILYIDSLCGRSDIFETASILVEGFGRVRGANFPRSHWLYSWLLTLRIALPCVIIATMIKNDIREQSEHNIQDK